MTNINLLCECFLLEGWYFSIRVQEGNGT